MKEENTFDEGERAYYHDFLLKAHYTEILKGSRTILSQITRILIGRTRKHQQQANKWWSVTSARAETPTNASWLSARAPKGGGVRLVQTAHQARNSEESIGLISGRRYIGNGTPPPTARTRRLWRCFSVHSLRALYRRTSVSLTPTQTGEHLSQDIHPVSYISICV